MDPSVKHTTVVVSPLKSPMADQVTRLAALGISSVAVMDGIKTTNINDKIKIFFSIVSKSINVISISPFVKFILWNYGDI